MHRKNDEDKDYWKEMKFVYGSSQLHPISVSPGLAYDDADYGYIFFLCHHGYKWNWFHIYQLEFVLS